MSLLKERLQRNMKIESVDFVNFDKVSCQIEFTEPISVMEILNNRVEEFITMVYFNQRLFLMGFIGITCIVKELPIKVISNEDDKCFSLSIKRDFLKILDKKEELKLNLSEGYIKWSFKYGEGYIVKTMRPTSSIYEVKKYLDFVLNFGIGNKEGSVNLNDIKRIHKTLTKLEANPMARNVILGEGYIYSVLPSYAIYKNSSTNSNTLLTENIISNLPRANEEFEIRTYKGFSGLVSIKTNTYFVFKTMQNKDLIEPYTRLKIDWLGKMKGMHSVIKVLTFGDKQKEIGIEFNMRNGTVTIKDLETENNQFIGIAEIFKDYNIQISSIIQDFTDLESLGHVTDKGKEHLKAILFKEGEICLLR